MTTGAVLLYLCSLYLRSKFAPKSLQKLRSIFTLARLTADAKSSDQTQANLLSNSEKAETENMVCSDCRNISTPEMPCECEIDDWQSDSQDKTCMLQFSLYYNYHDSHLFLHIICAINVPQRWYGKYPSTRVRFQVLPDTDNCYETEIRSSTAEPIFNETFEFIGYSQSQLLELKLRLGLYAYDKFSRKKMLGFTELPFNTVSWDASQPVILWRDLEPRTQVKKSTFNEDDFRDFNSKRI